MIVLDLGATDNIDIAGSREILFDESCFLRSYVSSLHFVDRAGPCHTVVYSITKQSQKALGASAAL